MPKTREEIQDEKERQDMILHATSNIVCASIERNLLVNHAQLPEFIRSIQGALMQLGSPAAPAEPVTPQVPAVPVKKSVQPDHLICLEDGKMFKSLKRHISTKYGLTPEAYRAKWGLPDNYPMVAPNYAAQRSQLAKDMGLGKKPN